MKSLRNYYEILRVSADAPVEIITAAYRALLYSLKKHPDLGGDEREASEINVAYAILRDPQKRREYDLILRTTQKKITRKKNEERRQAFRRSVNIIISYCLVHDSRWYSARVRDISYGGLKLVTSEPLGKGQEITITSANPTTQALRGTARWSRMTNPSLFERLYEAGIAFDQEVEDIDGRFMI